MISDCHVDVCFQIFQNITNYTTIQSYENHVSKRQYNVRSIHMFALKISSSTCNLTIILSVLFSEWWLYERFVEADVYVSGYGWANSLRNAWAVSTGHGQYWDYFREPLHGCFVGSVGFWIQDFGKAGVWISSLCVQLVLFCNACTIATMCSQNKNKYISVSIGIVFTAISLPYTSHGAMDILFPSLGFVVLTLTCVRYFHFQTFEMRRS